MTRRHVTLLSDFGTADGYAAAMAGVVATAAPEAELHTASHAVPRGDVEAAALSLARYAFLYPEGTVHLVVVDPGVGTGRRALAGRIAGRYFVAPDNGVLTRILGGEPERALVALDARRVRVEDAAPDIPLSATFHGRDLFAPAAARLARGEALDTLGAPIDDPVMLDLPEARLDGVEVEGEVIRVDGFGNLISNVPGAWLRREDVPVQRWRVRVGQHEVGPLRRTYGDVEPGELLALIGSLDTVEVSVRDGSAAERLGSGRGVPVRVAVSA